jgi:hypothetical protein
VTGPVRPALHLAPDDSDQVPRLAAFRAAHPGVIVEAGEFGTWQGRIPEQDGETVITRHRLGELLDKLGALLGAAGDELDGGGEFPDAS